LGGIPGPKINRGVWKTQGKEKLTRLQKKTQPEPGSIDLLRTERGNISPRWRGVVGRVNVKCGVDREEGEIEIGEHGTNFNLVDLRLPRPWGLNYLD